MAPNKKRNAGRQLLITRNRLREKSDQRKTASLRRLEATLLIELGQFNEAVSVAGALAETGSGDGSDAAFYADVLARTGKWGLAERQFRIARDRCIIAGRTDKARSLESGPLYLMAEAREDWKMCLGLAGIPVLRSRTARLSGACESNEVQIQNEADSPWREIALLERVCGGGDPALLRGILDRWSAGEAEWRWRILFEGAVIWADRGYSMKQWRSYLRSTGRNILDPRYHSERKSLKKALSGGFVKKGPQ